MFRPEGPSLGCILHADLDKNTISDHPYGHSFVFLLTEHRIIHLILTLHTHVFFNYNSLHFTWIEEKEDFCMLGPTP
jgi:hypothetical protein